jgi:hypothetical protein
VQEAGVHRLVRAGRRALHGVDDTVEEVPQLQLVGGKQRSRDGQGREHDEMDGAVDGDDPQDDLVAQRLAAQRQLDLLTRRRQIALRLVRQSQRQPAVAANAAVPAQPVLLAHDQLVPRPQPGRVRADQLVAADSADDQLPVETRPVEPRPLRPRRSVLLRHARDARRVG